MGFSQPTGLFLSADADCPSLDTRLAMAFVPEAQRRVLGSDSCLLHSHRHVILTRVAVLDVRDSTQLRSYQKASSELGLLVGMSREWLGVYRQPGREKAWWQKPGRQGSWVLVLALPLTPLSDAGHSRLTLGIGLDPYDPLWLSSPAWGRMLPGRDEKPCVISALG